MQQLELFPLNLLEQAGNAQIVRAHERYAETLLDAECEFLIQSEWFHKPDNSNWQPYDWDYIEQYHPSIYAEWSRD